MDIQQRINKARGTFSRLKNVWSSNNNNLHIKIKLFNACVKSALLYGCETWFVKNNTTQKLQALLLWPRIITDQELWEKTGQSEIDVEIKRRKYGWIGHTLRKSQNEICHSVLEWNPQGRRSRGRPNATWRRTFLAECGKISFGELRAQARNRHRWKLKTDGLCSTGVWL